MTLSKVKPIMKVQVPASLAVRAYAGVPSTGRRLVPAAAAASPASSSTAKVRGAATAGLPFMLPSYETAYNPMSPIEAVKQAFRLRQSRLEEQWRQDQLEAELFHFKHVLRPRNITLQEIGEFREEEPLRHFLAEELPIRWAQRLQLVESLPGWTENELMQEIHAVYVDAFKRLRKVDTSNMHAFRSALQNIKQRSSSVLPSLVQGIRAMHLDMGEARANEFLDTFIALRIGTDILTSQYLGLTRECPACVVQPDCNVANIVRSAAEDACRLCKYHYCHAPEVDVTIAGQVTFPCITEFLDYIMFELLKNSSRAVVERYGESCSSHPIKVDISGDDASISVKISDQGVGIDQDQMDKVWSYLWTTARPQEKRRDLAYGATCKDEESISPMAGYGCGLPLSRCYAGYVGGSMFLTSAPHHGTDAYVHLNRSSSGIEASPSSYDFLPRP
mmetsp:Transcript_13868/g.24171  ORF Transcript_13868/g.24171 Transcript_13868/m.24171 type:complete len:447 (-) Transcript_13868:32-1372(-)